MNASIMLTTLSFMFEQLSNLCEAIDSGYDATGKATPGNLWYKNNLEGHTRCFVDTHHVHTSGIQFFVGPNEILLYFENGHLVVRSHFVHQTEVTNVFIATSSFEEFSDEFLAYCAKFNQAKIARVRVSERDTDKEFDAVLVTDKYISELFVLDRAVESGLDVLKYVQEKAKTEDKLKETKQLLEHLKENQKGIMIGNVYFNWEQIKDCLV